MIQSGLDWDSLHQLVSRHRLGPLLYEHVNATAAPDLPRQVLLDLWRTHEQNLRRNAALAVEAGRIASRLEQAGIPALPFKGPALAQQLYGRVGMREFEDLDLLVPADRLAEAKALLIADHYDVADALTPAAEAAMYRSPAQYHRVFIHRITGEKLEVHWKTDPYFPVEDARDPAWWNGLGRMTLGGREVRALGADDLLLMLCLHATKHQAHRLCWILEIARLIAIETIDWEAITTRVAARRIRRRVYVALLLAVDIFDAPLPAGLSADLRRDVRVASASAAIETRLFTPEADELPSAQRLRLNLQLRDTAAQRLRHLYDVTFAASQHEWSRHPLPHGLEWLYVPLRMIRLLLKYGSLQRRP